MRKRPTSGARGKTQLVSQAVTPAGKTAFRVFGLETSLSYGTRRYNRRSPGWCPGRDRRPAGRSSHAVGAIQEGRGDAAQVRAVAVEGGIISRAAVGGDLERQFLQHVRFAIGVVGGAAGERAAGHGADILVLDFLHHQDIRAVQVVDDLEGDVVQAGLVSGIAGRNVVIGRSDRSQERSATLGQPALPVKSQPEKGLSR